MEFQVIHLVIAAVIAFVAAAIILQTYLDNPLKMPL